MESPRPAPDTQRAGLIRTEKAVEDARLIFRGNADPDVFHSAPQLLTEGLLVRI
jgi:hypothetical protein